VNRRGAQEHSPACRRRTDACTVSRLVIPSISCRHYSCYSCAAGRASGRLVVSPAGRAADRAFFRDVLECPFVDAGHNWLIFALPPAELAVHPADTDNGQDLFLMCDDVEAFTSQMSERGVVCSQIGTEQWGSITKIRSPVAEHSVSMSESPIAAHRRLITYMVHVASNLIAAMSGWLRHGFKARRTSRRGMGRPMR
jgi:hypothetical protein